MGEAFECDRCEELVEGKPATVIEAVRCDHPDFKRKGDGVAKLCHECAWDFVAFMERQHQGGATAGDVQLITSTTDDRQGIAHQTWVAERGQARGVGTTKADALRGLAADMERREMRAERGDL